jgi:hypothetical protein
MTVLKTLTNTSPSHPKKTTTDGLILELDWLQHVIYHRIEGFLKGTALVPLSNFPTPSLGTGCFYSAFIQQHQMTAEERLALITSLASHIRPEIFDVFHVKNPQTRSPVHTIWRPCRRSGICTNRGHSLFFSWAAKHGYTFAVHASVSIRSFFS